MTHLDDVKLTYTQHLFQTMVYSFYSMSASIIFIIHGFFPDTFSHTGSNIIEWINDDIKTYNYKDNYKDNYKNN